MRILIYLLFLLFFTNNIFSQEIGTVSFEAEKTPEVYMEGLSDTLFWTGRVIITFSDLENFVVKETKLVNYIVRTKDKKENICGTMLSGINPCDERFDSLYTVMDEKIRQFDFQKTEDGQSLYSKRISFLIHFLILPCPAPSTPKPK